MELKSVDYLFDDKDLKKVQDEGQSITGTKPILQKKTVVYNF